MQIKIPRSLILKKIKPNWIVWIVLFIACIATLLIFGAFTIYWLQFGNSELSKSPADWGPFGDFIGGVTNPILSFFALLSLLLTLFLQSKQLDSAKVEIEHSRKVSAKQIEYLKNETKKTDIYRTIQVLENRLENLYREPIIVVKNGQIEQWELYLLFSHATDITLKCVPPLENTGPLEHRNEYLRSKGTLTQLHITLVKLSIQLTQLSNLDHSEQFSQFYDPTITYMADKLSKIGYLPDSDALTIKFNKKFRENIRQNMYKTK